MKKRVLCAMSGGVDSSVSALLLLEQGYDVLGVTMVLQDNALLNSDGSSEALLSPEVRDARSVCDRLCIEHLAVDYRELFCEKVIEPFCSSYLAGRTPNPCIECNKYLKFGALQKLREDTDCDYVATGHYARIVWNERTHRFDLRTAEDASKDQSYVLYHVSQEHLAHTLLPLGAMTKTEVRARAQAAGFENAQKAESQDICFIPDGDYAAFIQGRTSCAFQPGPIIDENARVLGGHRGLAYYTIGQRKGLGVAVGEPLFVLRKEAESNTLVVGRAGATGVTTLRAHDVSVHDEALCCEWVLVDAKINYRAKRRSARARVEGGVLTVVFKEPVRSAAPGQAVVLYQQDRVVAGAVIGETF